MFPGEDLGDLGFSGVDRAMFSIVPVLVIVIFVAVIGTIVVMMVRGAKQWHENNQSPVLEVQARVVTKRSDVRYHRHHDAGHTAMDHTSSATCYYATFEVASGDRMEFAISGQQYGLLAEQDEGTLKFQGTRYLGFTRYTGA